MEELLRPEELTEFLKIYKVTQYLLIKEGKISAIEIGKQLSKKNIFKNSS
ncbi:hypothetical protein J7K25_07830 [bacterium]|nr:hypothetical protein [bacterium]